MSVSDDQEFIEFVAARGRSLLKTAYALTGDSDLAEDVVQTALVKVFLAWRRVRRDRSEAAYARQVVLRTFIDEGRRPWRRREITRDVLPELASADRSDATRSIDTHGPVVEAYEAAAQKHAGGRWSVGTGRTSLSSRPLQPWGSRLAQSRVRRLEPSTAFGSRW